MSPLPPERLKALAIELAAAMPPYPGDAEPHESGTTKGRSVPLAEIGDKVAQAAGVLALLRAAQFSAEPVTREEVAAACWCASGALEAANAELSAAELSAREVRHG